MRPASSLLLLFVGACDAHEPVAPSAKATAGAPIEVVNTHVSLSPPSEATEVAPGVFILTLNRPSGARTRIEDIAEIIFVETIFDENGKEAATSVPSSPWSLLSPETKVRLAGMKEGERRRIWTCSPPERSKCKVEDVMIGDRDKAVGSRGAT